MKVQTERNAGDGRFLESRLRLTGDRRLGPDGERRVIGHEVAAYVVLLLGYDP
jgi:hypothetical protein